MNNNNEINAQKLLSNSHQKFTFENISAFHKGKIEKETF